VTHDLDILERGRKVLLQESEALSRQAQLLDDSFVKAVRLIIDCNGRVIVTGMGKSGHIARKIAATLASTGQPSHFVHPGEAGHGDLGMIVKGDVVIAISNSGEAAELAAILHYSRRFSIPLIAITSGHESTLAVAGDIILLLPKEPEVGAGGLAPTTSTTMTLALGDALAVAVFESRGFSPEDFKNFHPGGKLGRALLRVEEIMHPRESLPLVKKTDTMDHVLVVMTEKGFGCAGVVDETGHLEGIITDGDLRRHMSKDLVQKTAASLMTRHPMTVAPRLMAVEALNILNEKKRTQVFVVDSQNIPVGILHIHDLLRAGIS